MGTVQRLTTPSRPAARPTGAIIIPAEPASPVADLDGDEAIALMASEMARAFDADGVLVAWHDGGSDPVVLYTQGKCEPGLLDEQLARGDMLDGIRRLDGDERWRSIDGTGTGMLTTSILASGGRITVTAFFGRVGGGARARARDSAARFLPMLRPFFKLWALRRGAMARVRGLTAAVNKTDVGILLLDGRGRVTFANAAAEALLREGDGFRRTGELPGGARLADTLRLQAAIEHVLAGDGGTAAMPAPVVALHRRDRRPLLAAVAAGDRDGREGTSAGGDNAAIVYLFDPEQNLRPLLEPACKLYGLSPVETKLTCHLADGLSLAAAAERMRVRDQTARSYLKQIFLKTETNRQAELVWLMLKSSVRTAPGCRTSFV